MSGPTFQENSTAHAGVNGIFHIDILSRAYVWDTRRSGSRHMMVFTCLQLITGCWPIWWFFSDWRGRLVRAS